jgi:hypothetical protein
MDFERYAVELNPKCVCGCMEGGSIHKIFRFPNDYGASVVSAPKADLTARGTFRLYVLHFESPPPELDYEIARDTGLTGDYLVSKTGRRRRSGSRRFTSFPWESAPAPTIIEISAGKLIIS